MFTRLLIGLDGSPEADQALEQAIVLAHRFSATLVVVHVREKHDDDAGETLLARGRERVTAAAGSVKVETILRTGNPDLELADLATGVDAALVGRRGVTTRGGALGETVSSLIRIAQRCVIVCGGSPSPMRSCAVAFDGGETSLRALDLAARFASVAGSTIHVIHATGDRDAGVQVLGTAEATLSLQGVAFQTHIAVGEPGQVVADVIRATRCDALFVGAHLERQTGRPSQPVVSHAEQILRQTDLPVVIQP